MTCSAGRSVRVVRIWMLSVVLDDDVDVAVHL